MTDIDPLLGRTLPPPSGPPQPPFVPSARSTTELPVRATARPRRRHPAIGGRIVAAGLGATTMFGLIAVMGVAQAASSSTTSTPAGGGSLTPLPTIAPVPTVTPAPAATSAPVVAAPDPNVAAAQAAPAPTVAAVPAAAPAPIVLQARPDVQVVTPAPAQAVPAPVATTSGSG